MGLFGTLVVAIGLLDQMEQQSFQTSCSEQSEKIKQIAYDECVMGGGNDCSAVADRTYDIVKQGCPGTTYKNK